MTSKPSWFYRGMIALFLLGILLELAALVSILRGDDDSDGNIAIVEVAGPIEASQEIVKKLRKFEENKDVYAIVVRVNSPGGTVGSSQEIHDEVLRIKAKKPVVVSMGDVAASGGYYLSAPATKIIANPGTITGSIGVIATYFVVDDLLKKFHLKWEVIAAGKMKDIGSPLRSLTPEEKAFMKNLTGDMHAQFIEAVAKGRNMPLEKATELSDGRVYSGRQAKELGLVDDLGGLQYAIEVAARLSNLKDKPKPIYPAEEKFGFFKSLSQKLSLKSGLSVNYQMTP